MSGARRLEESVEVFVDEVAKLGLFKRRFAVDCGNMERDCSDVCNSAIKGILKRNVTGLSLSNFTFYADLVKEMNLTNGKPISLFLRNILDLNIQSFTVSKKLFGCINLLLVTSDWETDCLKKERNDLHTKLQNEVYVFTSYVFHESKKHLWIHYMKNIVENFRRALLYLVANVEPNQGNLYIQYIKSLKSCSQGIK